MDLLVYSAISRSVFFLFNRSSRKAIENSVIVGNPFRGTPLFSRLGEENYLHSFLIRATCGVKCWRNQNRLIKAAMIGLQQCLRLLRRKSRGVVNRREASGKSKRKELTCL